MKPFLSLCFFASTLFFCADKALASQCRTPPFEEIMRHADVVFTGKAVKTDFVTREMAEQAARKYKFDRKYIFNFLPDTYTDFDITAQYKGAAQKQIRIFYSTRQHGDELQPFAAGTETTLTANKVEDFYRTYGATCSVQHGSHELKALKESYDAIDVMIRENPAQPEYYIQKADMQENYKDHINAVQTYQNLIAGVMNAANDNKIMIGYGRNLYFLAKYEEALKTLEPLAALEPAKTLTHLAKLHSGRAGELSGQKLKLAGQTLSNATIENVDLSGSDFSGAHLGKVTFKNVQMNGANFSGAQMYISMHESDMRGVNFTEANIRGKISDTKWDDSSFKKAVMDLEEASGNSFAGSDFSSANLSFKDCEQVSGGKRGNYFSGLNYDEKTVFSFGGKKIDSTDFMSLKLNLGKVFDQAGCVLYK